jgi:acid phosphatase type 7
MKWLIGALLVLAAFISLQIYSPLGKDENGVPLSSPSNILGLTSDKTEFLVFGDSGNGSGHQRQLASEMEKTNATLFLHVGDIAYQRGRADELKKYFADIYANLLRSKKAYPSPGNHDYLTNNLAPYLAYFNPPKQALNNRDQGRYYSFDEENIHFVSLDTNSPLNESNDRRQDDMLDWLEKDLSQTDKQWKIVYFHHPPYSSGHEHGPDLRVQQKIVPILEKYKVDLVFSGHEHNYERTCQMLQDQCADGGITYIVTGGGGAGLYGFAEPEPYSVMRSVNYELVDVIVEGCKLNGKVIGLSSKELDNFSLIKCS